MITKKQMKTFVTFGTRHQHEINGVLFDSECIAVIDCDSPEEGRKMAFELFGRKFAFEYAEHEWDHRYDYLYNRGFINVE